MLVKETVQAREDNAARYGVFSGSGDEILPAQYSSIEYRSRTRRFKVATGHAPPRYGYLDEAGNVVVPIVYERLNRISNGGDEPTDVAVRDGQYGYIDHQTGQVLIDTLYERLYVPTLLTDHKGRGIALARRAGKWAVLSTDGRALTPFVYEELDELDHQTLRGVRGQQAFRITLRDNRVMRTEPLASGH